MAEGDGLALGEALGYERVQESVGVYARVPVEGVGPVTVQERVRVTVPGEGVWEGGLGVRVLTVVVREAERVVVAVGTADAVGDAEGERDVDGPEGVRVADSVRRPVMEPEVDAEREALGVGVAVKGLAVGVRDVCVHEAERVDWDAERVVVGVGGPLRLAVRLALGVTVTLLLHDRVGPESETVAEAVGAREAGDRVRVREIVGDADADPRAERTADAVAVPLLEPERLLEPVRDSDGEDGVAEGRVAVCVLRLGDALTEW